MVINKSMDILEKADISKLSKFRKPAQEIKEIKLEWNQQLNQYEELGYSKQDSLNRKKEATKYQLLESLKKQAIPGPFTNADEVRSFMLNVPEGKEKNDRLYDEVKYARITCTTLGPNASVFRLK